jgi:hypothetical protein
MFGFLHVHARKVSVATAALCIGAVPHLAMALPANEIHETFYDGPNFQKPVGSYYLSCFGHPQFKGIETDYMHYVSYPCSNHHITPVNECLVCPDNNPGDDCIVEACPPVFFQETHGKLHSGKKPSQ